TDGTRTSDYLANFGFDVRHLSQICETWPDLFVAEPVDLSPTGHAAFMNIGLRKEQVPTSHPVEPTTSLPPTLAEIVPPDQVQDLLWKPASKDMARSRNDPRITKGERVRHRTPLVEIT